MDEDSRLIALFAYETHGGKDALLWKNPWFFSHPGGQGGKELDEAFSKWKQTKRPFTEEEVTQGEWSKIGDHGYSFKVRFLPGGKYIERDITREESWEGTWKLVGVALRMNVGEYELDVIANKKGNTHSGVEVADGKALVYFKMIHEVEAVDDPLGIR